MDLVHERWAKLTIFVFVVLKKNSINFLIKRLSKGISINVRLYKLTTANVFSSFFLKKQSLLFHEQQRVVYQ